MTRRRDTHSGGTISRRAFLAGSAGGAALALTGCATGTEQLFSGGGSGTHITVAIVSNSQMEDAISLSPLFEQEHPGIHLDFVSLPENEARAKITADVSTQGGEFDVVMISNYETPMWSANGWLVNLSRYINNTPGYDAQDFLPQLRATLSHKGDLYSVPFYGESSFLMYRKDLMTKYGITMPRSQPGSRWRRSPRPSTRRPGWHLHARRPGLGGGPGPDGHGDQHLRRPVVRPAVAGPADQHRGDERGHRLRVAGAEVRRAGRACCWFLRVRHAVQPGRRGHVVRRHLGRGHDRGPGQQQGGGQERLRLGPDPGGLPSGWLYTWSLAIPKTSPHKQAAWDFISWMTSKTYIKTVGQKLGWSHVPPGSRFSSYQIPQYKKLSAVYGPLTLQSINATNSAHPCLKPVPYTGVQFLDIPEFQDLGTNVSEQFSAAIAGSQSVQYALSQAQKYAQAVGETYRK